MATRTPEELALFNLARETLSGFSYSKCWRLVDAYVARCATADFGSWIQSHRCPTNGVAVADPTGEAAVLNVLRQTNKR